MKRVIISILSCTLFAGTAVMSFAADGKEGKIKQRKENQQKETKRTKVFLSGEAFTWPLCSAAGGTHPPGAASCPCHSTESSFPNHFLLR